MATHTVNIDGWHPFYLNMTVGRHWSVKHRLRRADGDLLKVEMVMKAGIPPAAGKRRLTVKLVLGKRMRGPDPDAIWKGLLDNLVLIGLLRGDSKEWVEVAPLQYERGPKKATVITMEDMP